MANAGNGKVLLVCWDDANWDLVNPLLDAGELPHLGALTHQGVMGDMVSSWPLMRPMVYNSVATGKHADKHGVFGTHEISDHGRSLRPVTSASRRTKAFWEILSQNDIPCHVVNFPGTGPAETINGTFVAPSFFKNIPPNYWDPFDLPPECVCPEDQLTTLQPFLTSLEDIDHQSMSLFVRNLDQVDPTDRRLGTLTTLVAHTFSVHAVATWLMENTDWQVMSVNYQPIELMGREFLRFHPPKLDWVDQQDYELFNDVVSSAVRFCDLLLGRLLELAGNDATVIVYSPRGHVSPQQLPQGAVPPGPRAEASVHRPTGIFAMRSPTTRQDELVHGASMCDVCPTLLRVCGLPLGRDLDGRALDDAFSEPLPEVEAIDSWDRRKPERPEPVPALEPAPWPEAMGFDSRYAHKQALRIQLEHDWNRAEVYMHTGRGFLAAPLLTRLYYTNPFRTDMMIMVAECLFQNGLGEEAATVMRAFVACHPDTPYGRFMSGMIAFREGREYEALDFFEESAKDDPSYPYLFFYLGEACRTAGYQQRAIQAYGRAAQLDPNFVLAHLGLAKTHQLAGDHEAGAEVALTALAVDFANPISHVVLGQNLLALGDQERAKQAFETALRYAPEYAAARECLEDLTGNADSHEAVVDLTNIASTRASWEVDDCRMAIHSARNDVIAWANEVSKGFVAANKRLDTYLAANATSDTDQTDATGADISSLMVRPAMPADLPQLSWMASHAIAEPYEHELFVVHGRDQEELLGGLILRMADEVGHTVIMAAHSLSLSGMLSAGVSEDELWQMLVRAGIARAAAGGAQEVTLMLSQEDDQAQSQFLQQLGFEVKKREKMMTMGMAKTSEYCQRVVERYERRHAIPDDVRPVKMKDLPMYKVDRFFRGYFDDGIGPKRMELDTDISLMIMKGDEIIAGYVGYVQGDTFLSTRFAVADEYRSGWATSLLLWKGPGYAYEQGLVTIGMYMDETIFPGMAKIARHMGGEEFPGTTTMGLKFAVPWHEDPSE